MRTETMVRPILAIAACAAIACAPWAIGPARAQDSMGERLSMDRLAAIQPGAYLAGDAVRFVLSPFNGDFLVRFQDSPEVFVLYADNASLGGRVLKYDDGETAMRVAVWGGMTLYTDGSPGGLPVTRTGDAPPPSPPMIGPGEMQNIMSAESQRLFTARRLQIGFNVDWGGFGSPLARSYAFNAIENAARGIERFTTSAVGHDAVARRIDTVVVAATGGRPDFALSGRTLVVMFNSGRGFAGCASSRAMTQWLGATLWPRR
ncbi:MAG TPA: DUF4908 domain-containing protein [Rhizomicrobium sp.]|nr:DUF4908 domain-containing protein [Rhizomicrobium sp.]